ncbi:dihydroorotase, homodimeric type [Saprolegnia diclina VS20]|uniref:Dihydroorotase, mitochondrial n=1 Tax=Saprolegnia diclina (strain VS20) TaxID=1156394 RepID=T0R7N0_SAPDV|nr:dihydroorotase, homodimeric type [Saprolegnia diclina VS20]EQC28088.1 dihydroorotase, homodimeric type [Saprolegnia diclina VS20]|eukprot:XP_008618513.1 dihydroorotase, homodimeric type [Saprolegnia diclina VS20]
MSTSARSPLRLRAADDMHHHLRDGAALKLTVEQASAQFRRVVVMPNLVPPVTTAEKAVAYRERILAHVPAGRAFEPLMTLYMTDGTTPETIRAAKASGVVHAVKYYPAGATTNSDSGVTKIDNIYPVLETMAELGMPLLVHGEVTDQTVDIFDREAAFIESVLKPLIARFPRLKLVMEHITTADAVKFVSEAPANVGATITCHHLLYNRNAIFQGGLRPHKYCLPVLKRETHRLALLGAIQSGSPKFFLGTDSAPHIVEKKHSGCGCAGIHTAHAALELYAEAFDAAGCLPHFEKFCSENGARFYGLPLNDGSVTLAHTTWTVPESYAFDTSAVVPLRAGETIAWKKTD